MLLLAVAARQIGRPVFGPLLGIIGCCPRWPWRRSGARPADLERAKGLVGGVTGSWCAAQSARDEGFGPLRALTSEAPGH
jgi:hypothetical protein